MMNRIFRPKRESPQDFPISQWVEAEPYFITGVTSINGLKPDEFLRELKDELVKNYTLSWPSTNIEQKESAVIHHTRFSLYNYNPPVLLTLTRLDYLQSQQHPDGGYGITVRARYWKPGRFQESELGKILSSLGFKPRSTFTDNHQTHKVH